MSFNFHPVARYQRASDAIDWLQRAFGFEKHAVFPGPNNTIAHAELRFGTGSIGLSSAGPVDPANVWTTVREGVYVSIDDPDARHDRAKAAGATIERGLQDQDYGSREFTARDHEGHLWGFGTYSMSDVPGAPVFYPGLRYESGARAVEFLTSAFGLEAGLQVPGEHGDVHHAELWLGNGVVMIGSGPDPKWCWAERQQCTYVYVADPDRHHATAASAGAHIVLAPETTSYGSRGYLVQDLEGFLWSFSTYRPQRQDPR
jgi:uncharacterized glyoxalase superfamily protein PhnB